MIELEVVYLDGIVERFVLPAGVQVTRTPDLIQVGTVEIERRAVRRTAVNQREE